MALNTEKNSYTLLFAIGLVVIVGTLLASVDASLKEKIKVNKVLEKQQNILPNKYIFRIIMLSKMKMLT